MPPINSTSALPAALGSSSGTAPEPPDLEPPDFLSSEEPELNHCLHQRRMLLQLQPPTLWLLQLKLLSMPLLASASAAGDTNDKPATSDNTNTKRFNMT